MTDRITFAQWNAFLAHWDSGSYVGERFGRAFCRHFRFRSQRLWDMQYEATARHLILESFVEHPAAGGLPPAPF